MSVIQHLSYVVEERLRLITRGRTMPSSFAAVAMAETYEEVKRLLSHTVHQFVRRNGGDYDELRSEADLVFMKVYKSHVYGTSSFSHWLRLKVWMALQEVRRTAMARENRLPRVYLDLEGLSSKPEGVFDPSEFVEGKNLSKDGLKMVMLVLDPPADVRYTARSRGDKPSSYRAALREYLKDSGWGVERMDKTFRHIRKRL